jgi:nitroreductase
MSRTTEHDIHALFLDRWSPRAFTGETIDEATLHRFFEAARWAPSSFNSQPWRFIYGRRDTLHWQPIFDALSESNRLWAGRASVLIAVVSATTWVPPGKTDRQPLGSHSFDTGAAWASLAFQATHAGWHAHGMGGFDRDRLRANLAVPEDHRLEAVVAIGKRADKSVLPESLQLREQPNQRRPLGELVAEGRFGFER